jgi:RHS repeat-associated protein
MEPKRNRNLTVADSDKKRNYHEEGRLTPKTGGGYQLEYTLKDHLGNARINFADVNVNGSINAASEILQEETDYPFGLQQSGLNTSIAGVENKYQYNGKEFNDELGLNMYDYGARFYDAALGRWNVLDKEIEKYPTLSAYSYCLNNPLIFIDPTGNVVEEADNEETKTYLTMLKKDPKAASTLETLEKSDIVYHINVSANLDEETYGSVAAKMDIGGTTLYDPKNGNVNILVHFNSENSAENLAALADEVRTGGLIEEEKIGLVGPDGSFAYDLKDEVETKIAAVDALKANGLTVADADPNGLREGTETMKKIAKGETDTKALVDELFKSKYGKGYTNKNKYNDNKASSIFYYMPIEVKKTGYIFKSKGKTKKELVNE